MDENDRTLGYITKVLVDCAEVHKDAFTQSGRDYLTKRKNDYSEWLYENRLNTRHKIMKLVKTMI